MIGEEDKYIILRCALNNFFRAFPWNKTFISRQNIQEHIGVYIISTVIDFCISIYIYSFLAVGWLIEYFAREGVSCIVCNIIIGKHNNFLWVKSFLNNHLVGM